MEREARPRGEKGLECQVLSASEPHLAMAGKKFVAWVAIDPGRGSPVSETRSGIGLYQDLYLQVKTHLYTGHAQ